MNKKRLVIIIISAILLVAVIATTIILVVNNNSAPATDNPEGEGASENDPTYVVHGEDNEIEDNWDTDWE